MLTEGNRKRVIFACLTMLSMAPLIKFYAFSTETQRRPIILYWTTFGGKIYPVGEAVERKIFRLCPEAKCQLANNRSLFNQSSALVFHHNLDFLFMPPGRLKKQHFVFMVFESPVHVPWSFIHIPEEFYTLTMTYKTDADLFFPYSSIGRRSEPLPSDFWETLRERVEGRHKLVAWFVSNCYTHSKRELYVDKLIEYIPVDIYGLCGSLYCKRGNESCFTDLMSLNYKFTIAMENSICENYITEKFFRALNNFVVPIVLKRSIYVNLVPNNSFIAADDFSSPKELAEYLQTLSNDTDAYMQYFKWLSHSQVYDSEYHESLSFCKLCKLISRIGQDDIVQPSETAKNVREWYTRTGTCIENFAVKLLNSK